MDTFPLIQRGFASLPATVSEYYFRAESACCDEQALQWLADPHRPAGPAGPIGLTVSADMTEPLHAVCAAVPEATWQPHEERPDETVHCSEVEFVRGNWRMDAEALRYVALRVRKRQGVLFASGSATKYLAVVSNRWDVPAAASFADTGRRRGRSSWSTTSPRTSSAPASRPVRLWRTSGPMRPGIASASLPTTS